MAKNENARNIDQIGTPTMRPEGPLVYIYFYILSVCVVDHALTALPIDFIFGMHIDVIPRSDIGILDFSFLTIKDHLWTILCFRSM